MSDCSPMFPLRKKEWIHARFRSLQNLLPRIRQRRHDPGSKKIIMVDGMAKLVTGLKNAAKAGVDTVSVPYSKAVLGATELLEKEGYVRNISRRGKKVTKAIEFKLVYRDGKPLVSGGKRISSQSKRVYLRAKDIKSVRQGYGIIAISTTKGIKADREARKNNLGGEPLFSIW
jgi:small subunit ribosomal protein S8